ncbi:MAG: rimK [Planctomycetaceae bacterium]|nr:rimK [Planctomycetaceae bacterium]
MQIAILGRPESWYAKDLSRVIRERGHEVLLVPFEKLTASVGLRGYPAVLGGDQDLSTCDAVIVRTMPPGSLEQVVFRMDALVRLEAAGKIVLNPPRAVECAVDKYLTTARLAEAGLPVPETVVCETACAALEVFDRLGGDVVVKPIFGSEGRGIVRVSDPDLALRTFRTIERTQSVLYLQRFIDHPGCDLRVMVLNGQILGGMRRCCPDDFRVNVSRSGHAESVPLTPEQVDWALRAAAAVGAPLAGIDLLYDRRGQGYVIEVNGVPGWQAFRRVTGVDVATKVVQYLEDRNSDTSS